MEVSGCYALCRTSEISVRNSFFECVAGVCSCAHSPRLPTPIVSAKTISIHGELFVNITWSLPKPTEPRRLPPMLKKQFYYVSIGKQMVSDVHPAPWFAHTVSRRVDAVGFVDEQDTRRWHLLPVTERSIARSDRRSDRNIVLDVKLLARALWAVFGGACVLAIVALLAVSARVVKTVLNKFRPASASSPLQPLGHRPLWFPLSA
ncbi:unnamed protein product [Euphydryas editha]|uniref:Uncharacterized protein n=1 Tax=Euphydryas editha TaxID=104508 RepID=A0AAU9UBG4_EUPED|nr:unnamed protein product [Euphydryas editha]